MKSLNIKNFTIIILCLTILFSFTGCLNIESVSSHNEKESGKADKIILQNGEGIKITLNVKCDTLLNEKDVTDYTGKNGILISSEYTVKKGSTAFEVLKAVCTSSKMTLNYGGTGDTTYITSINGIDEKEYSEYSGWCFEVNGEYPSMSCASYVLKEGDTIDFYYITSF